MKKTTLTAGTTAATTAAGTLQVTITVRESSERRANVTSTGQRS